MSSVSLLKLSMFSFFSSIVIIALSGFFIMAGVKSSQAIQYCVTSMLVLVLIVSPHSMAQKADFPDSWFDMVFITSWTLGV